MHGSPCSVCVGSCPRATGMWAPTLRVILLCVHHAFAAVVAMVFSILQEAKEGEGEEGLLGDEGHEEKHARAVEAEQQQPQKDEHPRAREERADGEQTLIGPRCSCGGL